MAFLHRVTPAQAFVIGTSSFRLDLLDEYLSDAGAARYFASLGRAKPPRGELRRFAEALLSEALGVHVRPGVEYTSQGQYVDDAFAIPVNRARADGIFLGLCEKIGRFWGTLVAIKAYSHGESFVGRNVGLRAACGDGGWEVRIVFMDHDGLTAGPTMFRPDGWVAGCRRDFTYIQGGPPGAPLSELDHLASIYRANDDLKERGRAVLLTASARANRAAGRIVRTAAGKEAMRDLFGEEYIDMVLTWDEFAAAYLSLRRAGSDTAQAAELLRTRGYEEIRIEHYQNVAMEFEDFLGFVYLTLGEQGDP